MSPTLEQFAKPARRDAPRPRRERRTQQRKSSLFANGEPMVWLTGGALALALCMIVGLLSLVIVQGIGTFWPAALIQKKLLDGRVVAGEVAVHESYRPDERAFDALPEAARSVARANVAARGGAAERQMIRSGNFDLSGEHFTWVSDVETASETRPEWMLVVERQSWGRFYGTPLRFLLDGAPAAETPEAAWALFERHHDDVRSRFEERERLKREDIGRINARTERERLNMRSVELEEGLDSPRYLAATAKHDEVALKADADFALVRAKIDAIDRENARTKLVLVTADGIEKELGLDEIVRAYPANRLGFFSKLGVYFSRWAEFLFGEPREANSEGGVFPAIFGTIAMTLIMTILVEIGRAHV